MNILIIDDDQDTLAGVREILEEDGHDVENAVTLGEAFKRGDLTAFSVVLVERCLCEGDEKQYLLGLRQRAPDAAVIIITGYADLEGTSETIRLGAVDYFVRPLQPDWLKLRLRRIIEIREAAERVAHAERLAAIGQMVAVLSHESRNELQLAVTCLEVLAMEVGDQPRALDLVRKIEHAHQHLLLLFEDLRGYAAPVNLNRERHDLREIVLDAWNSLSPLRSGRSVWFEADQDGERPDCDVDRPRLEQVFRNILENALAACADPVEITCRLTEAQLNGHRVAQIAFEDNGPGLSREQALKVFDPFFTTKSNGTGLGMAICKQIVEAHGGTIGVESPAGRGARFVVALPLAEQPLEANRKFGDEAPSDKQNVDNCCGGRLATQAVAAGRSGGSRDAGVSSAGVSRCKGPTTRPQ